MRLPAGLLLLFLAVPAGAASRDFGDLPVVARLVSVEPKQADCGIQFVGTTATYLVIEGPAALSGKQIKVVVPCIEMPRKMYGPEAGDLDAFVPGQTHHLIVTKQKARLGAPEKLPDDPDGFYLKAASLGPL